MDCDLKWLVCNRWLFGKAKAEHSYGGMKDGVTLEKANMDTLMCKNVVDCRTHHPYLSGVE